MHLQQGEDMRPQGQEIHCLSALIEKQQGANEINDPSQVFSEEMKSSPTHSEAQLGEMWVEILSMILGTVSIMQGSMVCDFQQGSCTNCGSLKDICAEEPTFSSSYQPHHARLMDTVQGDWNQPQLNPWKAAIPMHHTTRLQQPKVIGFHTGIKKDAGAQSQ